MTSDSLFYFWLGSVLVIGLTTPQSAWALTCAEQITKASAECVARTGLENARTCRAQAEARGCIAPKASGASALPTTEEELETANKVIDELGKIRSGQAPGPTPAPPIKGIQVPPPKQAPRQEVNTVSRSPNSPLTKSARSDSI